MTASTYLKFTLVEEGQSQKATAVNASDTRIEGKVAGILTKALSDANYVMADSEALANNVLRFTGALTAARTITLPASNGCMWCVENATTGGFALNFKIAAGAVLVGVAASARSFIVNVNGEARYVTLS